MIQEMTAEDQQGGNQEAFMDFLKQHYQKDGGELDEEVGFSPRDRCRV